MLMQHCRSWAVPPWTDWSRRAASRRRAALGLAPLHNSECAARDQCPPMSPTLGISAAPDRLPHPAGDDRLSGRG